MDTAIASALIGAGSALAVTLFKDFLFVRLNKRNEKIENENDILRLYVAPLSSASTKLVWRFSEIFLGNRYQFLKSATLPLVYNEYKRKSTLFRIATLLGWIRAIELELNALPNGGVGFSPNVRSAIEDVHKALADGPDVELARLAGLVDLWGIPLDGVADTKRLALQLELEIYRAAGAELKHDANYIKQLDRDRKLSVCRAVADLICDATRTKRLEDLMLSETLEQAATRMSFREALIYRDWQDAIADAMLVRDDDSDRRFRTVGYAEFEAILDREDSWMEVFRGCIIDIDFEAIDKNDYRAIQLSRLSSATAKIIIALKETSQQDLASVEAVAEARKLVNCGAPV